jgi:hypothetical protein
VPPETTIQSICISRTRHDFEEWSHVLTDFGTNVPNMVDNRPDAVRQNNRQQLQIDMVVRVKDLQGFVEAGQVALDGGMVGHLSRLALGQFVHGGARLFHASSVEDVDGVLYVFGHFEFLTRIGQPSAADSKFVEKVLTALANKGSTNTKRQKLTCAIFQGS